jgi:hypothetical protein
MATKAESRKAAEQQIAEKEKRIMDAIRMRIPDRVPVICSLGYLVARYTGIPSSAAYYDFPAWLAAYKKTIPDFPADLVFVCKASLPARPSKSSSLVSSVGRDMGSTSTPVTSPLKSRT